MKIRYAVNVRIPTPRAHGLQIMKTCEALAKAGAEVELVVPRRYNAITTDPYTYYGVERAFKIVYLPTFFEVRWRGLSYGFALQTFTFALSLAWHLARKKGDGFELYVRGELGWLLPRVSRVSFVWENHIRPRRAAEARAVRAARGIVVVTKQYRQDLLRDYKLAEDAMLVAPDGVDLTDFTLEISREEARKRLGLPPAATLALYAGSDLPWKGVRYLREAAELLPEGYEVVFVGPISPGPERAKERFVGEQPHRDMPLWLAAADVLVLMGDPASETARYYTSPMKLFEYMAARRPIVAVDLPSFRDVLSEDSAIFVVPGDAEALAEGIVRATGLGAHARIARAWEEVQAYTWARRASSLTAFMGARGVL